MQTFFISDLHLGPTHPELFARFRDFLQRIQPNANDLYILGDFFEYWIGDDLQTDFHQEVIRTLAHYSKLFPIYFMPGNRDFLLTDPFYKQSGCIPINDPTWINLDNYSILLLHGDSLCTDKPAYRYYRALSRKQGVQRQFLRLPQWLRQKVANILRGKEMEHYDDLAKDVPPTMLAALIKQQKPQILIHGHTHYPLIELQLSEPIYTRYVLAAWGEQGNALSLNEKNEFELLFFK